MSTDTHATCISLRHFCSRAHTLTLSVNVYKLCIIFYTCVDLATTSLLGHFKNVDDDDDLAVSVRSTKNGGDTQSVIVGRHCRYFDVIYDAVR